MKPAFTSTRLIGLLFLLAFLLYGVGNGLLTATEQTHELSATEPARELARWAGYGLVALNSVAVITIAVLFFPILNRYSSPVALSYLVARVVEAVLLVVGILSPGNTVAYQLAMLVLGVSSIGFCAVLLRARLVPKPLAVLGLIGYAGLALGALGELMGLPVGIMLSIPGGLFELCFGLLLLTKGFAASRLPKATGD